jgi:hypothetical protein
MLDFPETDSSFSEVNSSLTLRQLETFLDPALTIDDDFITNITSITWSFANLSEEDKTYLMDKFGNSKRFKQIAPPKYLAKEERVFNMEEIIDILLNYGDANFMHNLEDLKRSYAQLDLIDKMNLQAAAPRERMALLLEEKK